LPGRNRAYFFASFFSRFGTGPRKSRPARSDMGLRTAQFDLISAANPTIEADWPPTRMNVLLSPKQGPVRLASLSIFWTKPEKPLTSHCTAKSQPISPLPTWCQNVRHLSLAAQRRNDSDAATICCQENSLVATRQLLVVSKHFFEIPHMRMWVFAFFERGIILPTRSHQLRFACSVAFRRGKYSRL